MTLLRVGLTADIKCFQFENMLYFQYDSPLKNLFCPLSRADPRSYFRL